MLPGESPLLRSGGGGYRKGCDREERIGKSITIIYTLNEDSELPSYVMTVMCTPRTFRS
jgi:hypothetical protein